MAGPGRRQEKALIALALALAGALLGYILYPEVITQRGASFRPEIWADALRQISEHPWLGHGYDHPMRIVLSNGMLLADPHNIELGVLFAGGIIGLLLWVAIYALAFAFSWKNRKSPAVLLASTWLVFGLAAGLTEGNAFLPRPKEHWFLIWIPMALLYALWIQQGSPPAGAVKIPPRLERGGISGQEKNSRAMPRKVFSFQYFSGKPESSSRASTLSRFEHLRNIELRKRMITCS